LREISDLESLNEFFDSVNIEEDFRKYLVSKGVGIPAADWKISGKIIMTQVKAITGRYSKLDDYAFYPIYGEIDNVITTAMAQ